MVISQYSFVGYDHRLLSLILCGVLALASVVIWIWNRKPPISVLLGIITLGAVAALHPPDALANLVVLLVMAGGAWLESKYLSTSRGFLWVFAFAVWTAGNLVYDFKSPHWIRLRDDQLMEERGDVLMIQKRQKVHVVHATRSIKEVKVNLEFWSVEDGQQALQVFDNELYMDLDNHLYTGQAVADAIAKWAHGKILEKSLAPQSINLQPWEKG